MQGFLVLFRCLVVLFSISHGTIVSVPSISQFVLVFPVICLKFSFFYIHHDLSGYACCFAKNRVISFSLIEGLLLLLET